MDDQDLDHLPPFANKENVELNKQRIAQENALRRLDLDLEENDNRVAVMNSHLKSVQTEVNTTQELVRMKNSEKETEDHMKRLAERENGRIKLELQKLASQRAQIQEKINMAQNSIFKGEKQLQDIMSQMDWDQEELDQWLLASKQKEEDNLALEKYSKQDQSRIKARSLEVEKLTKAVEEVRKELDKEVTETQAAQIELDKTAEDFRRLHKERQQLVQQWEEAVEAISRRDQAVAQAEEQLVSAKAQVRQREILLEEKNRFLKEEQDNNVDCNRKINAADRQVKRYREGLGYAQEDIVEYRDQVKTIDNEVNKVASDLVARKKEIVSLRDEIKAKNARIEKAEKARAAAKEKLELTKGETLSLEQRVAMLEELHKQEELHAKEVDKAVQEVKDQVFRQSQDLFKLRQEEANLIAEITGAQAAKKNLKASIIRLDQQSLKQQELIYNQEFQLQQLERKVSRAEGDRSDEEKQILNERIATLQKQLEDQNATKKLLSQQLKKLQDDLRRSERKLVTGEKEVATLTTKIEELELENDSAQRTVQSAMEEKERRMVDANVLKLEVKRLNEVLAQRTDEVLGLTNRKYQLQMTTQERSAEIAVHRDVLWAKMKASEEERHNAKNELRDRLLKVDKLKNKYEIMMTKFSPEEGNEEHTQAYFVIKAAQEREELMRHGDELSEKITTAEKEIRSLENTLAALGMSNVDMKNKFKKTESTGEEYEKKLALEEHLRAALDKLKSKRREVKEMKEELVVLESSLVDVEREQTTLYQEIEKLDSQKGGLEKELNDQKLKQDRSFVQMRKLSKQHRESRGIPPDADSFEEKDFLVRELKDFNKKLLRELASVCQGDLDMMQELEEKLKEHGMSLPTSASARATPSHQRTQRPGSAGSRSDRSSDSGRSTNRGSSFAGSRPSSRASGRGEASSTVFPPIAGASTTPRGAQGMRGTKTPLKTTQPRRPGSASSTASARSTASRASQASRTSFASKGSQRSIRSLPSAGSRQSGRGAAVVELQL